MHGAHVSLRYIPFRPGDDLFQHVVQQLGGGEEQQNAAIKRHSMIRAVTAKRLLKRALQRVRSKYQDDANDAAPDAAGGGHHKHGHGHGHGSKMPAQEKGGNFARGNSELFDDEDDEESGDEDGGGLLYGARKKKGGAGGSGGDVGEAASGAAQEAREEDPQPLLFGSRTQHVEKKKVVLRDEDFSFQGATRDDLSEIDPDEDARFRELGDVMGMQERHRMDLRDVYADAEMVNPHEVPFYERDSHNDYFNSCVRMLNAMHVLSKDSPETLSEKLQHVADVFRADQSAKARIIKNLMREEEQIFELKKELMVQLALAPESTFYSPDSFSSPEAHAQFLRAEQLEIEEMIANAKPRPKSKPKKIQNKQLSSKNSNSSGGGGFFSSLFGCCSGPAVAEVVEDPEPSSASASANARGMDDVQKQEFAKADAQAERVQLEEEVAAEIERRRGDKNALNAFAAYRLLLWTIVQHETDAFGSVDKATILTNRTGIPPVSISPLSDVAVNILESFGKLYRVGGVRRGLDHLQLLVWNRSNRESYFATVWDALYRLQELRRSKVIPWTIDEEAEYPKLVRSVLDWTMECLSRYHKTFHENDAAMKECVYVLNEAWDVCQALGLSIPVRNNHGHSHYSTISQVLTDVMGEAISFNYREMVQLSARKTPTPSADPGPVAKAPASSKSKSCSKSSASASNAPSSQGKALAEAHNASMTHSRSIQELQLDGNFPALGGITDLPQIVQLFDSVDEEIKSDLKSDEVAFDAVEEFSLARVSAETYLMHLWSDATIFLRIRGEEEFLKTHYSSNVFKLYDKMRYFWATLSKIIEMGNYELQMWFKPFVRYWLKTRQDQFTGEYLDRLTNNEDWKPVSPTQHFSHSVLDLFRLLYPVCRGFKKLAYSKEHMEQFALFIQSVIKGYVDRVAATLRRELDKLDENRSAWGYDVDRESGKISVAIHDEFTIRMNNMQICKIKLFELLEQIDLERAYDHVPRVTSRYETRGNFDEPDRRSTSFSMSASLSMSEADEEASAERDRLMTVLGCDESFRYIQEVVDEICERVARGWASFCSRVIGNVVWKEPILEDFDDLLVQELLRPLWDYSYAQLDNVTDKATGDDDSTPDLYDDIFYNLAQRFFSNRSFLLRKRIMAVSLNAGFSQISAKSCKASTRRFFVSSSYSFWS